MKEDLKTTHIETPVGQMLAIADKKALYLLEFIGKKGLERELRGLQQHVTLTAGETPVLISIKKELKAYFEGRLRAFTTPYHLWGTPFQQQVWKALCQIPFAETRSYLVQSTTLGKPRAYRAVAQANGANRLAIIIPCHRVIASDGTLGGYSGGLTIKQWLINHEKGVKLC